MDHCGFGDVVPVEGCAPADAFGGRKGVGRASWAIAAVENRIGKRRSTRDFIALRVVVQFNRDLDAQSVQFCTCHWRCSYNVTC